MDKTIHKKLLEGLSHLSEGENAAHWQAMLAELKQAYEHTIEMVQLAEVSAEHYNRMQTAVRIQMISEMKARKRSERKVREKENQLEKTVLLSLA